MNLSRILIGVTLGACLIVASKVYQRDDRLAIIEQALANDRRGMALGTPLEMKVIRRDEVADSSTRIGYSSLTVSVSGRNGTGVVKVRLEKDVVREVEWID